jgi:uncharacterized repeat protein (TIGR02059 family)
MSFVKKYMGKRECIFLVILTISSAVFAKTYYVAPSGGSDSYAGTITQPWSTWQKAFNTAQAGDTVYFRGGVWYPSTCVTHDPASGHGHNGTFSDPVCFFNYPGEIPILDCKNFTSTTNANGLDIRNNTYLKFRGLTVRNVKQNVSDQYIAAIQIYQSGNIWLENISSYNNWGHGFQFYSYDTLHVTNCDSYNNADSISVREGIGNRADGFSMGSGPGDADTFKIVYITGCRAWRNSDDGFDIGSTKQYEVSNCWSFLNGYLPEGGGVGFKTTCSYVKIPSKRRIHHTLSAFNSFPAYADQNLLDETSGPVVEYYNNTAYKCQIGFGSDNNAFNCNTGFGLVIYRNNLVYKSRETFYDQTYLTACHNNPPYYPSYTVTDHNTWNFKTEHPYWYYNPAVKVTDDDFAVAPDSTMAIAELTAARQPDGSLPEITFLKLKEGSDLIDAGVDVGLPYSGKAPDMGYSEYNSGTVTIPAPVFQSAVIENATPARLDITYSLTLAAIIPPASAFSVKVNTVTRSVSAVTVSGTKVYLTLGTPVVYGDNVTVAYTIPSTNPLQTTVGGQAATITPQNVTNKVTAIPVYLSSVVENATPARLDITYSLTLSNIVPATSAFSVKVNTVTRNVSSVSVSGTKVYLTLGTPIIYGDNVTVAYTKPSTNPLQTTGGGQAATISPQNVTNNVAAAIPVYISSVVENATPARLDITYSLALSNIVPVATAFAVRVNSVARNVSSVTISGTKVYLALSSPVVYGDVVTLAYTRPSTNPLQTSSGGVAASFTAQQVINNCSLAANLPPVVSISSPTKNTEFVAPANVTIYATATDPDGNISKVEFYRGETKLGECLTSPYFFTWKDVPAGTYLLTAIATDNLNSKTVSDPVTIIVEKSGTAINQLPVINLTTPNKKVKYKRHDNISFVAEASDPDGSISQVEFKNGDATLAIITNEPFVYTLQDVDTGNYAITAIATDNLGASTISEALQLHVEPNNNYSDLIDLYPNPNNGSFKINILSDLPEQNNNIVIYNLSGRIVYKDVLSDNPGLPMDIDLPEIVPGTYILMVSTGKNIISAKKFIKR